MLDEVHQAALFWSSFLRDHICRDEFCEALQGVLVERFKGHWYPNERQRGSAFRAISYENRVDPVLIAAAEKCGVRCIHRLLEEARFLVMFINPGEVKVRNLQDWSAGSKYLFRDGHRFPLELSNLSPSLSPCPTPPLSPTEADGELASPSSDSSSHKLSATARPFVAGQPSASSYSLDSNHHASSARRWHPSQLQQQQQQQQQQPQHMPNLS